MIEKRLKTINGKIFVKIPDHLNELTIGQMMELQERPLLNDLEAISILSGNSLDELKNATNMDAFSIFNDCVLSLTNQIKYLYDCDAIPNKITFFTGKCSIKVSVIKNLSVEPVGAFMAAREIIADEINEYISQHGVGSLKENFNPSLKACCQVLAHYFFSKVTGKNYNEYEAEEFCNEIKKLRVTEALPIAKHFFTCYPNLSRQKTNFFRQFLQFWKNAQAYNPLRSLNTLTP